MTKRSDRPEVQAIAQSKANLGALRKWVKDLAGAIRRKSAIARTDRGLSDYDLEEIARMWGTVAFIGEFSRDRLRLLVTSPQIRDLWTRDNPDDVPPWLIRYLAGIGTRTQVAASSAHLAYGEPKRYALQFQNVVDEMRAIEKLAHHGKRRVERDAHDLGGMDTNPSGDEEIDAERALDRIERARREAKKYTDKLQGFFERGEKIPQGFMKFHQAAIDKFKKASGVRGHYGKRKPSARANPEQLPRLALLGSAVEIRTSRSTLKPRGALLLVSEDGRQIVIARPTSRQAIAAPSGAARARGMFAKWAGRKSERALRLSVPTSALSFDLGDVLAIRYRSDKWGGRAQLYEHKFEGKATAIADAPRAPRLIRIDGKPARVLVTERGIVG